jgi:hypothetical protein
LLRCACRCHLLRNAHLSHRRAIVARVADEGLQHSRTLRNGVGSDFRSQILTYGRRLILFIRHHIPGSTGSIEVDRRRADAVLDGRLHLSFSRRTADTEEECHTQPVNLTVRSGQNFIGSAFLKSGMFGVTLTLRSHASGAFQAWRADVAL